MTHLLFHTRTDAGTQLGRELAALGLKEAPDTLVLGLVRGGIVVGAAIAEELALPLHPYIVRKIGHPEDREYALGAIAEGGSTYMDDAAMRMSNVSWKKLEPVIEEEMQELKRRRETYAIKPRPNTKGACVVLADDGAATGATLFAAIQDLRKAGAGKIVVALPVCPPDTAETVRKMADTAVLLATPASFMTVGQWYRDFPQVTDEEVLRLLAEGHTISA
ncbi:MAG: phosphoribosyltransferase family protein [Candidatus Peribacteraceae bacterium]|nr:phosphoribosyltransferase family protein [Candidatus Peribacteraceae bacterium]